MKKTVDLKVEIIRILCCFLVICYHIRPQVIVNAEIKESVVFVEAICSICVNTFFILSGFFIYENRNNIAVSFLHVLKNFIKNIFIPFLFVAFISFIFNDAFFFKKSAIDCIKDMDILAIIKEIGVGIRYLIVYTWPLSTAHLWYVFAYAFIILFYPITKLILKYFDKRIKYLIVIILLLIWISFDVIVYYFKFEDNYYLNLVPKVITFSMIGQIVYNDFIKKYFFTEDSNKSISKNNKLLIISILFYILTVGSLFLLQISYLKNVNGFYVYTSYNSFLALVESVLVIIIIYNLNFMNYINDKAKHIIKIISDATYGIYLVHWSVLITLASSGIQGMFFMKMTNMFTNIIYYIVFGGLVFSISLLIVSFVKLIKNSLVRGVIYVKKKRLH